MAVDLAMCEDTTARQTWHEPDGMAYRRVYNLPPDFMSSASMPKEGDPMPGESSALLGPFIEKGGITFEKQRDGAKQRLVLKCKLLEAYA